MKSTSTVHYQGKKGDGFQGDKSQVEKRGTLHP